jgi:hypothetical protein
VTPRTILVVEDNPITRKMMRFALESEGYEVLEAADGRTALGLMAKRRPDLVLQDYVLPDMDGLRLLESLRSLPGGAELPVLMITGMVSQIDELRAQAVGRTSILPKPIEPSRLLEVVASYMAGESSTLGKGRRVLVVDDETLGRKLAALRLRDAGFEVETAGGGEEALRRARLSPPDAILSDVLMPGMDGFQLCQAVRGDARLAPVPVVLLSSAFVEEPDQRLARQMGASALLVRTPDMRDAIDTLAETLREGRTAPSAAPAEQVAVLYTERVQLQLEKQVARNESLLRQGAIQAAALSVVRGLALALGNPRDVPSILGDVLVHCLDAAGLSTGLLYLSGPGGRLRLQAQAGLPSEARAAAAQCFGHPEILQRALEVGEPVAHLFGTAGQEPALRELGSGLAAASGLIVPFLVEQEPLGVLVLAADSQDLTEPVWTGFGRALAVQFGQTIALARSLSRGAASEARYRSLMEHAQDAIFVLDPQGTILEANRRMEELLGRPRGAILGRDFRDFVPPAERDEGRQAFEELLATGSVRVAERHYQRPDGQLVPVEISAAVVDVGGERIGLVIARDVTERKRAELKLQQSEEQYRLLFESNPHPMWVYDPETLAFLAVNDAAVAHYGYSREEFLAMTLEDIRPPEDVDALREDLAAAGRGISKGLWRHRKKDGTLIDVEISAQNVSFGGRRGRLVLANDITDRRRLEDQLRQAQKMEAVGQLAGGVAHDFNNLLGVITGFTELLMKDIGPEHRGYRRVEEIRKAADRAASLTRQLLTFSRKQVVQPQVVDLNELICETEKMLRRLIGENIELVTALSPDLGRVRSDPGQVDQVIVNLAVNARDAMPGGGKLIIETANVTLDAGYSVNHAHVPPGPYVMLAVSDTGHGMDAVTQSRIFEPFFTTKELGKGTGLGLSTVYGIVKQSGGHIQVYSEVGRGTAVKVYLPRVESDERTVEGGALVEAPRPGSETILLVEDAESLRVMIREILEEGGYTVLESGEAEQALSVASAYEGPIPLMLTDVVMPGMSGREIADKLKGARPDTRVLYMSGYTDEAISHHGNLEPGTQFIQKPFTSDALLRKVREVLDAPQPGPPKVP